MPIVDIVVPCYRYGRFLPACIASILTQSVRDVRVLVIDDASPDDSTAVARRLAAADARVSLLTHAQNRGHIATYNEGIAWATAPYFLLLSADDVLADGALERAVAVMEQHPDVVLTHGRAPEFEGDHAIVAAALTAGTEGWQIRPGRELIEEICASAQDPVVTATAIVRTAAQKKVGGYRPELPHAGDFEMWLRFAAVGAVARTDCVQAFYRRHGENMSTGVYRSPLNDYLQRKAVFEAFFRGHGAALPDSATLRTRVFRRLAAQAFWTAAAQRCRGNHAVARELFRFAWQLAPSTRLVPPVTQLWRMQALDQKIVATLRDVVQAAGQRRPTP